MVGGEWQTHSNRRARPIGSLSAWCDLNLPSAKGAKIATLVAKKEATEGVVAILKKFQKRGAELSKVQRGVLEMELDGAGDWSAAATPPEPTRSMKAGIAADRIRVLEKQLAAAKLAGARRPPVQRGRSGGRGPEGRERTGSR